MVTKCSSHLTSISTTPSSCATSGGNLSYHDATSCHGITIGPLPQQRDYFFPSQIYEHLNHGILVWYDSTTLKVGKSCFLKLVQKPITLSVTIQLEKDGTHNK